MRKLNADSASVGKTVPAGYRGDEPTELVCLALVLALVALTLRISTIW